MAIRYLIRILGFFSLFFPAFESSTSDKAKVPNFAFSWLNDNNTFQAGDTAAIKIIVLGEFDSKGNASLDKNAFNPTLTVNGKKGNSSFVSGVFLDTSGDTSTWRITFAPIRVGVFNVFINDDPFKVFDSSLHYEALPGKIYPSVCIALWMGFLNEFEAGERATIFILPRDAFGNDVSSTGEELNSYNFTVSVLYANGSLANVPNITHVGWNELGIISIEFIAEKAGDLLLHVKGGKQTLNGSPLPLKVNPGYCDGSASIVNGSGLNDSIAGEISQFSVYLFDIFQYPAFVELGSIKVQIVRENDSYYVQPSIVPIINGNGPAQELSHTEISPAPSDVTMNISAGHFEVAASVFHVTYTAEKSGIYEIYVFCGNILLSGVQSFRKEVKAGEYFPKAYDDKISVWEDESIAFDVLANDYFAGHNASIVEFSKPNCGSLLQDGQFFRYTPYQNYYGNDSFMYTISDVNGNLAFATVSIDVLNIPPQFISFPSQLQATEDMISPRYGGFSGFEIRSSDPMENISVTLRADFGTLFLSPLLMQFWDPIWGKFLVKREDDEAKSLTLEGCVDVMNLALQSIQYLGNVNFSGNDTVRFSANNKNGINEIAVPAFVQSINDPPFINVPKFIILKGKEDKLLIFDKARDKFEFCVGDPDLLNFPGKKSHFIVAFSVEVNDGFLITSLPAELIDTTELKLINNYQWQPLQTYVTISKHFMVKAHGIRFRGTINDCNLVMQQLSYHGGENGAVLTLKVNDMGNYGCYSDCTDNISIPLHVKATVNLIRKRPMSSLAVHTLGSVVIIEFLMVLSFGVVLLFFTCKCAILLVNERSSFKFQNSKQSTLRNSQKESSSADLSEKTTDLTGGCSQYLSIYHRTSSFRQRSSRQFEIAESGQDIHSPSQSTRGYHLQALPDFMPLAIEKGS
ncbi:hypothetical protein MANES_04G046000v8 [Manihot esculenta]|uniref:Uncharacterized protein n=1 Tax=Manihot esculenta TaxID=3983 RepID=A0ACB7HUM5_MANES|nr:hypothetical protein MANES_04G046000v8 [Manihot esculenta]